MPVSAPICMTLIRIPIALTTIPLNQYVEAYRVYPQERTAETEQFAQGIAWKLQGVNPEARLLMVISLNLLDPVLDRHGNAAVRAGAAPAG